MGSEKCDLGFLNFYFFTCGYLKQKHIVNNLKQFKESFIVVLHVKKKLEFQENLQSL